MARLQAAKAQGNDSESTVKLLPPDEWAHLESIIPTEPTESDAAFNLRFTLPSGQSKTRRFDESTTLSILYNYARLELWRCQEGIEGVLQLRLDFPLTYLEDSEQFLKDILKTKKAVIRIEDRIF